MEDQEKQIYVALFAVLLISGTLISSVFAQPSVSNTQKRCEHLYIKYKELGSDEFKKRYSHHPLLKKCLELFNDPAWNFKGKLKIDNYYDRLKEKTQTNQKSDMSIKMEKKYRLSQNMFLIKFSACTNESVSKPSFLISSDSENFLGQSQKSLTNGKCLSSWTQIFATKPDSITVRFVEDISSYSSLKIKKI